MAEIKSKKEILRNLLKDTESGKIRWEISIEKALVKATHIIPVTSLKHIIIKIIYFNDTPKMSKLNILYQQIGEHGVHTKLITNIGGKNKGAEVKEVSYLLNRILLKEEQRNVDIFIEDDFKVGDRVVVIKTQDKEFQGEEKGQKGTIVGDLTENNVVMFVVKFDNHFSDILNDDDSKFGNCWAFWADNLKRIP